MQTRDEAVRAVESLSHGGECCIFSSEEGGGEVYRIYDSLFLFEIPQYGGDGRFARAFRLDEAEALVDLAKTWT